MKNIFLSIVLISLLSCVTNKKNISLSQRFSYKEVIIKPDIYSSTRDSLKIEIPLEVIIYNNTKTDFDFLDFDFLYDKKYVSTMDDFFITDTQNKKLSRFDLKLRKDDSVTLVLRTRATYISREYTEEAFKKYAINKDFEKFRDSAILVSYKEFRKKFPGFIKKLERIPDSLRITTGNKEEKGFKSKSFKINW